MAFFLEHDTGTEPLGRLVGKLVGYAVAGHEVGYRVTGAALLISVHSARREQALRTALPRLYERARHDATQLRHLPLPLYLPVIATAPRDHGHPHGPAGPVWALWHPPDAPSPTEHAAGHGPGQGRPPGLGFGLDRPARRRLRLGELPIPTDPPPPPSWEHAYG